jgi:hypothetical protein
MAKYISDKQYEFYKNIFKDKITRKTTPDNLWDLIHVELLNETTEIYIDLKKANVKFTINEVDYNCIRDRNEIIIISDSGNVVNEKYELLINDVIDYIIDNKLIKTKKPRKKKEKN